MFNTRYASLLESNYLNDNLFVSAGFVEIREGWIKYKKVTADQADEISNLKI